MKELEWFAKRVENSTKNVRNLKIPAKQIQWYEMVISDYKYLVEQLLLKLEQWN